MGHDFHVGFAEEEVDGLALVDPFLAAGGGVDEPLVVDLECRAVFVLDPGGDGFDAVEVAVVVFDFVHDFLRPEAFAFEVADHEGVEDDEVAGEVRLDVEVLVHRLDAGAGAHDVGDGGGGGDGEDVGVAHALGGDFGAEGRPIHAGGAIDFDGGAAFGFEEVDGVLREQAAAPL